MKVSNFLFSLAVQMVLCESKKRKSVYRCRDQHFRKVFTVKEAKILGAMHNTINITICYQMIIMIYIYIPIQ